MRKFRFLSLFICFILTFTFCGCTNKTNASNAVKTDIELLKEAIDKTDNCASFQMDAKNKMRYLINNEETVTESDITIQGELDEKGNPKMFFETSSEIEGLGEISIIFSYVDTYVYMDVLGQKIKTKADENQANLIMNENDGTALGIDVADILDASASKEGDKTIFFVNYNTEGLNKMLDSALKELKADATKTKFDSDYASVTVNAEGFVEKISISVSATVANAEIEEIKFNYWMDISYSKYNEKIGISAPKDANAYAEVDVNEVLKNDSATAA